jgi:type IV pilus assembly protein PilM
MFGGRSAPLLGLDIGSTSVRVVSLDRGMSGQWSVECCATDRLQPGWVVSDNIEKIDEVAQAIKRLIKKSGAKTRNVAMALPASAVMTRRVQVQSDLTDVDFEAQVEAEISPYLPWSIEDANVDFSILGGAHSDTELEVLVAAARREKIEERQVLAETAGLKLVAIDVEPFARARAVAFSSGREHDSGVKEDIVALFDMGSVSTALHIVRGEDVLFDRDLSFGGALLSQLLERTYNLSPTDAERQKRSRDLPSGYEGRVISPYIANLAAEVERGLQFFHGSSSQRVQSIVLSGGAACLPGFARAVASQTGLPCTLANPFAKLHIKSDALKKRMSREGPGYFTAVGLALRRLAP